MTRISLGAQTFAPRLLEVLERVPVQTTSGGRCTLFVMPRSTTSRSISSMGSRARSPPTSTTISRRLWRSPRSTSRCTSSRRSRARASPMPSGASSIRQSEAMEGYFERVVDTLTAAGYRWYETANFCLTGSAAAGRDLRAHHNLGYLARARLPRRRDRGRVDPRRPASPQRGVASARYVAALEAGGEPARELERLDASDESARNG